MALTRSDIKASAEDLEQFTTDLQRLSLGALWATEGMAAAPGRTTLRSWVKSTDGSVLLYSQLVEVVAPQR